MKLTSWDKIISNITIVFLLLVTSYAHAGKPLLEGGRNVGVAVLASDGTAWSWGENSRGELGNNLATDSAIPVQALDIANIADLSVGDFYSWTAAALTDGTVWVWGNVLGRMTQYIPYQVTGFTDIVDVAAGPWPMAAVRSDGTLWEYALNSIYNDDEPRQVEGVTNAVSVAVSLNNPYVLLNDGTVWTWEQVSVFNDSLGRSELVDELTQIEGLADIVQIDGGYNHALALRADGTLWAWGNNNYGQLGDGSFVESASARQVLELTGVYDISAGNRQSAAVLSDGTVWTWGRWKNILTDYASSPEQVLGFTNAVQVSTGSELGGLVMDSDGDVLEYDGTTVSAITDSDDIGLLNVGPVMESQIPSACRPTYFMNGKLRLPCVSLGGENILDVVLTLQPNSGLQFSVDSVITNPVATQSMRDCTVNYANNDANISCLVAMDVTLGLDSLLNVILTVVPDTNLLLDVTHLTSY
ncbi:MAG: hypothetical protein ABW157_05990 [Candidatus Thiodiazotropha sp. LLP2]